MRSRLAFWASSTMVLDAVDDPEWRERREDREYLDPVPDPPGFVMNLEDPIHMLPSESRGSESSTLR
eukprot:1696074-Alexandrium_andersonii.AAC.1